MGLTGLKKVIPFLLIVALMMTGCTNSTGKQIYKHLEKAASLEKAFNEVQTPLVQHEKQENKWYQEIMKLDMTGYKKIKKLADKALKSIEERAKLLEKEQKSIKEAYEAFQKIVPLVKKLEDKKARDAAEKLVDAMENRYNAYQKLHDAYKNSLQQDKKLYQMLSQKDLTIEKLRAQVEAVNKTYKKVETYKKAFNEATKAFNKYKQKLYEQLGYEMGKDTKGKNKKE